jgi:hypothetical protein
MNTLREVPIFKEEDHRRYWTLYRSTGGKWGRERGREEGGESRRRTERGGGGAGESARESERRILALGRGWEDGQDDEEREQWKACEDD